jgi:arsenate reductase
MPQTFTLYHNPKCGTSRNALALLQDAGAPLTVVEYLKVGWTRPQLQALLKKMGAAPRDILRLRGTPAEELGLTDPRVSDAAILDAMVLHPILVERPIAESATMAVLGRPVERVADLIGKTPNA